MKCKKTEHGVELIPESDYEKECLLHIKHQDNVKIEFEDTWNNTGNLIIQGEPHPWDKK